MTKAYINGQWVSVDVPQVDVGEREAYKQRMDELNAETLAMKAVVPTIARNLAPLSAGTPTLKRHFYQADSGYAVQGGCTDGTYLYFYIRNADDSKAGTLVKLRASGSYSTIKTVSMNLAHGGDMTYNPDTGLIYSTTSVGQGALYRIDVIDPVTLTKQGSLWNPRNGSRIAYERQRKMFLIGGTTTNAYYVQRLTDAGEFEHVRSFTLSQSPTSEVDGRGGQGICCDEGFIYISWSLPPKCIIEVFDWFGNYIGKIEKTITYDGRDAEMEFVDKTSKNDFVIGVYMVGLMNTVRVYSFSAT